MTGKSISEVWTRECCYIAELLNTPEWPELSVARARVEPGVSTEPHTVEVLEIYVIKQGMGAMHLGDEPPYEVGPGDSVTIPAGVLQFITNTGEDDLVFLCVCTPRFEQRLYCAPT